MLVVLMLCIDWSLRSSSGSPKTDARYGGQATDNVVRQRVKAVIQIRIRGKGVNYYWGELR
jgi:hypothetical protein